MNMKKAAGLIFVVFGGAGLLAACGPDDGEGATCTFDTDCASGLVCEQLRCTSTCESTADCNDGDICGPRTGDGAVGQVCFADETPPINNPPECTPDDDTCDEGFFCLVDTCVPEDGPTYYNIELRDTSSGDVCTDKTHGYETPGSKFMFAAIQDASGTNTLGWANYAGSAGETDSEYLEGALIFDGAAPDYGMGCPEAVTDYPRGDGGADVSKTNFTYDQIYAVGCNNSLFLNFLDASGDRVHLEAGQQLVVGEYSYGENVCRESQDDQIFQSAARSFSIFLCEATGTDLFDNSTCTHSLGANFEGTISTNITLP
ncbi:MAG: hypothetical protein ACNA8W_19045 [Bradymonadaceae bacterium]